MKLFLLASALILTLGCYRKQKAEPEYIYTDLDSCVHEFLGSRYITNSNIYKQGESIYIDSPYGNHKYIFSKKTCINIDSGFTLEDPFWNDIHILDSNQPMASNNLLLLDDSGNVIPKPSPIPDSLPKYRYFLTHDNPQRYFLALDSLNIISGLIGKSMLYEDALYWLNARARNLNILYYEGKVDSVKTGGKP